MRHNTLSPNDHIVANGDALENDCTHSNKGVIPDAHSTGRAKHPAITTLENAPVVAMREEGLRCISGRAGRSPRVPVPGSAAGAGRRSRRAWRACPGSPGVPSGAARWGRAKPSRLNHFKGLGKVGLPRYQAPYDNRRELIEDMIAQEAPHDQIFDSANRVHLLLAVLRIFSRKYVRSRISTEANSFDTISALRRDIPLFIILV